VPERPAAARKARKPAKRKKAKKPGLMDRIATHVRVAANAAPAPAERPEF
jgi:hypothetical protein